MEELRNVEVKAIAREGAEALEKLAAKLAGNEGEEIHQHDTFYRMDEKRGRLKLRRLSDKSQLVWYDRSDETDAKLSQYRIVTLTKEQTSDMDGVLNAALGRLPDVIKRRKLFIVGQTRIHVDRVEDLGDFMELEVVLNPDQTLEDGQKIVDWLLPQLHVKPEDLLAGAYLDLLIKKQAK